MAFGSSTSPSRPTPPRSLSLEIPNGDTHHDPVRGRQLVALVRDDHRGVGPGRRGALLETGFDRLRRRISFRLDIDLAEPCVRPRRLCAADCGDARERRRIGWHLRGSDRSNGQAAAPGPDGQGNAEPEQDDRLPLTCDRFTPRLDFASLRPIPFFRAPASLSLNLRERAAAKTRSLPRKSARQYGNSATCRENGTFFNRRRTPTPGSLPRIRCRETPLQRCNPGAVGFGQLLDLQGSREELPRVLVSLIVSFGPTVML